MNKPKLSQFMITSTLIIAVLSALASMLGLFTIWPYAHETADWMMQARGQDIGNLIAIIPLLIGLGLARRGSMRGFFVWIGALFYFLYAYIVYAMAVHFNALFLVYVTVLGLTLYTLIVAAPMLPSPKVDSDKARKYAGVVLIATGILFTLLWLSEIIPATLANTAPQPLQDAGLAANPVYVIDLAALLPAFIITGILTLKRRSKGLAYAAPWLMFTALMGASIVAALLISMANGAAAAVAPLVIVGLVMLVSLSALERYLRAVK